METEGGVGGGGLTILTKEVAMQRWPSCATDLSIPYDVILPPAVE